MPPAIATTSLGALPAIPLENMDLETAMFMIQAKRASLQEDQLKAQMVHVQKTNEKVQALNTVLSELNKLQALLPPGAGPDTALGDKVKKPDVERFMAALKPLGITSESLFGGKTSAQFQQLTKQNLDTAVAEIKNQVDGSSNTQQLDMLRLQSLSNKRNESFDLMTNFMKKSQDNRSAIIGNIR